MKRWTVAASSVLFIAGCGAAPDGDNSTAANATESPANATAPSNTSAGAAAGATNVAIGRWVQASGRCDEMVDVEFTARGVRMFGGPDGSSMDIPLTYTEATATSVTMQAEPGQPTMVATLRDPTHLDLTSPGRPERNCSLVRR